MESFVDSDDDDDDDYDDDEEEDDDDEDFMEGDSEEEEGGAGGRRRCRGGDFDDYRSDYTSTTEGTSVSRQYLRKAGRSGGGGGGGANSSRRRRDHQHGHKSHSHHHHYRNRNNMSRVSGNFFILLFPIASYLVTYVCLLFFSFSFANSSHLIIISYLTFKKTSKLAVSFSTSSDLLGKLLL